MNRRTFLCGLALGALGAPLAAVAFVEGLVGSMAINALQLS
jgi:hypothetical protein